MKLLLAALSFAALSSTTTAHASELKPAAGFACPFTSTMPKNPDYQVVMTVHQELVRTLDDALGPLAKDISDPKVAAKAAASRVDEKKMAALAEASGCGALFDQHSGCAQYFDTELGDPLSVLMAMKPGAPLRKQYELAIAQLARTDFKLAAQSCIKRVGTR